jgi:competence protein ComGE
MLSPSTLERVGLMLRNCKGFSMVEALSAILISFMIFGLFSVLVIQLYKERELLETERLALSTVHDQLQAYLYDQEAPTNGEIIVKNQTYTISWSDVEGGIVRGCIFWNDKLRDQSQQQCLYGKR